MTTTLERRSAALKAIARAIIYVRVSKDEAGGRSCREQVDSCTDDCEYEGWTIGLVLQDNDRGASRHSKREREEFLKLPGVLQRGDVLVVWEPSRITRDMSEFGIFCELMAARGVLLYYDGRVYDMNDDDDRHQVWQDILDGAKQNGKTRKRVLRAMSTNQKNRMPHGKKPPGLRIVRDERTGKPIGREIDPGQARVLRKAAERVLDDESCRSVARDLAPAWAAAGGGRFDARDVKRFLTNPTTFGLYHHNGEIDGKGEWPEVLDPELFTPLCALLNAPDRLLHRGSEPKWLLSCIARCGVCVAMGERGIVHHKGPNKKYRKPDCYVCCKYNHIGRNMDRVDAHVTELLMRLLEDPQTLRKLTAKDRAGRESIDMEMATVAELRTEIDTFVADARKTRMSAAVVAAYVVPLEDDIKAAQARIDALTMPMNPVLKGAVGSDARQRWFGTDTEEGYSIERKREIIRAAMDITLVRVPKRGRYTEVGVEVRPVGMLAG